ncbi:hypothetical protein BD413DRAFT_316457 [Trametes elegans]|nr:hypothetical protein BD413DRAFT_316457 [Trametes elegans]
MVARTSPKTERTSRGGGGWWHPTAVSIETRRDSKPQTELSTPLARAAKKDPGARLGSLLPCADCGLLLFKMAGRYSGSEPQRLEGAETHRTTQRMPPRSGRYAGRETSEGRGCQAEASCRCSAGEVDGQAVRPQAMRLRSPDSDLDSESDAQI